MTNDTRTPTKQTATTCPYCGVGCGVIVNHGNEVNVKGDTHHPANQGRLCVKGSALHETLGTQGRVTRSYVDGQQVGWEKAIQSIAHRLTSIREEYSPDAIGAYLSGQLLTEDYYVANKFFKGFVGTPHLDTNSRLCMAAAVVGHKRAFGADAVPCCYEDLEQARLLVIVGSNLAWNHPVLFQRVKAAKERNSAMKVVVIDPRITDTCEIADLFLGIRPKADITLFNGLLSYMAEQGMLHQAFIDEHTEGFDAALEKAQQQTCALEALANECDIDVERLTTFYHWFSHEPRVVTLFSQGTNQSDHGADRVNAIINCHLAGGRIGYKGAGPFSITGQPNAMGGREVGGLANQLAAHMDYETPGARDRLTRFWRTPSLEPGIPENAGYKALDLIEAIERGDIKALWIMATNPVVSLPDSQRVRRALKKCPLVIVSEAMTTSDTLDFADIVLPASSWAEKNGTVTNSERRISRQRGIFPPPGDAHHDWQALTEVAHAMGFGEAFNYQGPADIFNEHIALSGFENSREQGFRLFDLSGLGTLNQRSYDNLAPVQWPVNTQAPQGTPRLYEDAHFTTPSGRARFIAVQKEVIDVPPPHHFILNTGRIRDQWHTMTRTSRSARLNRHRSEPFIEINLKDAQRLGITSDSLLRLGNEQGSYTGRAQVSTRMRPGEIFIPIHWNNHFSHSSVASELIAPRRDPLSGQPASKFAHVQLSEIPLAWHAVVLMPTAPDVTLLDSLALDYWAIIKLKECYRIQLASEQFPDIQVLLNKLFSTAPTLQGGTGEKQNAIYLRAAWTNKGKLTGWFRSSPVNIALEDDWLDHCFAEDELSLEDRRQLLAGKPLGGESQGAIVCSCYQIGEHQIQRAITEGQTTVDALGKTLKCGTQCGSCLPEIKRIIQQIPVMPVENDAMS